MRRKDPSVIASVGITIIIALALAGGGYYYLDKQHDKELDSLKSNVDKTTNTAGDSTDNQNYPTAETTNTKTYTSESEGYTFKYPSNFYVYDDTNCTSDSDNLIPFTFSIVTEKQTNPEDFCVEPISDVFEIKRVNQQDEVTSIDFYEENNINLAQVVKSEITIDGMKASKYVEKTKNEYLNRYMTDIAILVNKNVYVISWENSDSKGTHPKVTDEILDTLKFSK